jgi:hypothetical protein
MLMVVMENVSANEATAQPFYKAYFVSLLKVRWCWWRWR